MYTVNGVQIIELCNAVVWQAAQDYRKALIKHHEYQDASKPKEAALWNRKVNEIEAWFSGEDFTFFTKLDGRALMKRIRQDVVECGYSTKAIQQSHRRPELEKGE